MSTRPKHIAQGFAPTAIAVVITRLINSPCIKVLSAERTESRRQKLLPKPLLALNPGIVPSMLLQVAG